MTDGAPCPRAVRTAMDLRPMRPEVQDRPELSSYTGTATGSWVVAPVRISRVAGVRRAW